MAEVGGVLAGGPLGASGNTPGGVLSRFRDSVCSTQRLLNVKRSYTAIIYRRFVPEAGDADAALFAAVQTFQRAMMEVVHPILDEGGVTKGEFFLLFFIGKMPRPTVGWIADQLGVRMSSATHLLNDLERRGLVRRERSSEDRRLVRPVVTALGSRLLVRIEGQALNRMRVASSGIAERHKSDAARLLIEVASRIRSAGTPDARVRPAHPRASPAPRKKPRRR